MPWNDLTLSDKARMIQLAVNSGITDLRTIHEVYNTYAEGGPKKKLIDRINTTSKANFVQRLKDPNRAYIPFEDGIATHRMSYATEDDSAIVYPEIQEIEGQLQSLEGREALESAIARGDTLRMSIPEAEWFTKNYKKYYPKGNTFRNGGPIELPSSYKKLSKEWKMRIDTLAKEHGANPAKIEEYYNEGRLTPLIGAYYTLKDNGRQRLNDTRTAEESMKHTTNSNKVMYGNVIKNPKNPSNNLQSGNPNFDAMVPYIPDKEARVLGNRVSTNLFDSLAVRVPKVKNASMQDAVGIVFQETGGGSVPWGNTNKTKEENTALLNGNYWREYGWMPAEYFGRDYRYNLREHEIPRSTHPFEHMLQYFETGKYNPGDPNHTSDVRNKGKEVMNTPAFKEWEKTSPYAKKIRMYHKYGGVLKLMTNL